MGANKIVKNRRLMIFFSFFIVTVTCIAIIFLYHGHEGKMGIVPLNVSIELIPGKSKADTSVVILRLFSRSLQQKAINKEKIEPFQLKIKENTWRDNIKFQLLSKNGEVSSLNKSDVSLLTAPKGNKLRFTHQTVYQAFYIIYPSYHLSSKDRLMAQLQIDHYKLNSNRVTIPPWPTSRFDAALRQARIDWLMGSDRLLESAETLIRENPESYLGYWYKGLALQRKKDPQKALQAFVSALKHYHQSTEKGYREPPVVIIQKIKELLKDSKK